jgi:hypothetical protein
MSNNELFPTSYSTKALLSKTTCPSIQAENRLNDRFGGYEVYVLLAEPQAAHTDPRNFSFSLEGIGFPRLEQLCAE